MRVVIRDIARRAGVSTTTVSRALNEKPDVDPVTAQRIKEIVKEMGYVPNASATILRRGRAYCLGMLVPSLTWHWMLEVLRGVAEETESSGYNLMLYTMTRDAETMHNLLRQLSAKTVDGLIVIDPGDYLAPLQHSGLPVVLIDHLGDYPDVPSVVATNFEGAYTATNHLLQLGRRRVAAITGDMAYGCSRARLAGYRSALGDAGIAFDADLLYEGDFAEARSAAAGAAAVESFLQHAPDFDAVFAFNDLMALGTVRALQKAGRKVPEDVAVVGFDDLPLMEMLHPALTTIHQPVYELGVTAVRMVQAALEGQTLAPLPVEVPTTLIVRESCGAHTAGEQQAQG